MLGREMMFYKIVNLLYNNLSVVCFKKLEQTIDRNKIMEKKGKDLETTNK